MTENMKKFLELVSRKEELTDKLNRASKEEILVMARELGVELDNCDFSQISELDENELDAVVGGGDCVCAAGGGGKKGEDADVCACVLAGVGYGISQGTKKERCLCCVGGYGMR